MNADNEKSLDSYRSYLLISEISKEENLSQRELAGRLGIALGLVNSYIKNLVAKGYVRVKNFPRNRYSYLLTPQGIAEKSRLAYQHLSYFTNLYTETRQQYRDLFQRLHADGVREVVFCGVDEVAEIAFLSMQEAGIGLKAVLDDERDGELFMGHDVKGLSCIKALAGTPVVITSLKRGRALMDRLSGTSPDLLLFMPGPEA